VAEALKSDLEEEGKAGWFGRSSVGRLAESMVQNLTVHVNRIHVRYEDVDLQTNEPFAAGITLESLQAEAAGGDWKACVGQLVEGAFRKLVSLTDLSVYWDMKSPPLVFHNAAEMASQMAALIHIEGMRSPPVHNYVLPPISGSAKFTFNVNYETTLKPQVQIGFDFGDISVSLGERQWRQLTHILEGVSSEIRGIHYRKLRPVEGVREAPRKWWQFAIEAILIDVRSKAESFTLKWIDAFCSDRKIYVGLWYIRLRAGKKKKGCWTAAQRESKRDIVKRRTVEQILSFRSIAEALYLRQRELLKKAQAETSNPFKRSKMETEIMDLNVAAMNAVQWAKLRESLSLADTGEDAFHAAAKSGLSPDYVRQDIGFELKGVSLKLLDMACANPIVSLALTRVAASYRGLEDGTSQLGALLGSLEMVDWMSRLGQATTVVHPTMALDLIAGEAPPLVQLSVELLPKGPRKVHVTARALDVVVSIPLVLRIRDFFGSGGASDALVHLREDAISAAARAIMSKAKVPLHLSVKIDAPNVVFCDDFKNWPYCTRLIGALGRLTLSSTEEDLYTASISNIRAFVALPQLKVWQDALLPSASSKDCTCVLEETSLDVEIKVKHGVRVHSEATVCVSGVFTTVPRVNASTEMVVDIVRVSLGLALSAMEFGNNNDILVEGTSVAVSTSSPSKTAVQVDLLMPSIEIVAASVSGENILTRLVLCDTLLTVQRDFVGRVDVTLGLGSLTALDCLGSEQTSAPPPRRMVWTESTDNSQKHVTLHVTSWPGDGAVDVDLDLFKINLALQRQTTLEIMSFSEILALTIVDLVPTQLKAKKSTNMSAHNVAFNLRTGDVQIMLLKRGAPFLLIGLAASTVKLQQFKDDRMHLELLLGAFCVENPVTTGPYKRLLATTGDHTAAVTVDTFKKEQAEYPGHDVAIQARVFSVTLIFMSRVLKDVSAYFAELEEMMSLLRAKAGQVAASAVRSKARALLQLDVEVATLVLPVSSEETTCFLARLQHLNLTGNPDGRLDLVVTAVTAASALFSGATDGFSDLRPILNEWSTRLVMERTVTEGQWGVAPDLAVSCSSEDALRVAIDGDQILLMINLIEKNLLQGSTPDDVELDSGLDVTVSNMRKQFKSSFAIDGNNNNNNNNIVALKSSNDMIALPVWIRVRLLLADAVVSFGAAKDVGLGVLQCRGLSLGLDSFDQFNVSVDVHSASLQDARSGQSGSLKLVESDCPAGSNVFELRFRQALGELDDLGLSLGEMCLVLDPKWLLALFHVLLPVLDRMLSLQERLETGEPAVVSSTKTKQVKGEGTHLVFKVKGPRVVTFEEADSIEPVRAMALSSSLIVLERTEVPGGKSCMDLQFRNVEIWKTRYGTTDRASILSPVLISMAWDEVSEEVASTTFSVGRLNVDFSYQDLILSHAVAVHWMNVWGEKKEATDAAVLIPNSTRPRQLSHPPAFESKNVPSTPVPQHQQPFRLELASNRAFVASVSDHPPRLCLEKRSDLSVQQVRFFNGRVVFDLTKEVNWCLTVEGLPGFGASVCVAQEHSAKAAVQLWDWLPASAASVTEGRLVLRSHPSWCLAVADVGSSTIEEFLPFELQQSSDDNSRQVWHLPGWVAQAMPKASPSPLVAKETLYNLQRQKLQQQLVLPERWSSNASAPPRAQQVSVHLTGLNLHVVDDLAGNVRPIARLALEEASLQVANWSNGGDLHCVFTIAMEADYFNEDSEAWEPLLRGMEDVASLRGKEKSLDVQVSVNRAGELDADGRRALLKVVFFDCSKNNFCICSQTRKKRVL
jgi:hypothetical protein